MLEKLKQKAGSWSKLQIAAFFAAACIVLSGVYLFVCYLASHQAAAIFNYAMSKQKVLMGTVTAETLSADLWGNVYFGNLRWLSPGDEQLLFIPKGRLKIKPRDVVFRQMSTSTIQELELEGAEIYLAFDEKMHLEIVQEEPKVKEEGAAAPTVDEVPEDKRHLQLPGEIPDVRLILKDITLDAKYKERHFVLNDVNCTAAVTDHNLLTITLSAGQYGGNMVGDGLNIDGTVELTGEQKANLNLGLYEVVPASLGLGDLKDPMTVTGQMTGPVQSPVIEGAVSMKELNIPGLMFTNVSGNYRYENALITFEDVTGGIYGGSLEAYGLYHFDNHHYNIDAKGKGLLAAAAARSTVISCSVDLDVKFRNLGRDGKALVYGSFESGAGSYMLVPFEGITGTFTNQGGETAFKDVIIRTALGSVESNAFRIVNGKLKLGEIFFVDKSGERMQLK